MRILNRPFLTYFCLICCIFIIGWIFLNGNSQKAQANNTQQDVDKEQQTNAHDPYAPYKKLIPADDWIMASDNALIPLRIWQAPSQRAIIIALHGFNDSRDAWEDSAHYFLDQGISIYSPDQRGFGQARLRGKWSSTDRMVQDVIDIVNITKQRFPNTPIYLMGESMGGAVLMCLAERSDAPPVNGYILLAPAVWGSKQIGMIGDLSLRFLNAVAPNWHLSARKAPIKRIVASDNEDSLLRLYFDPLSLHDSRVHAIYGLVKLMDDAIKAAPRIRYHSLVIYGDNDQLVPTGSMHAVWEKFPRWVRKDYVPGGYHLLLRDKNRKIVAKDIISWINDPDQWLPSGGDAATAAWMSVKGQGKIPFFLPSQVDNLVQ